MKNKKEFVFNIFEKIAPIYDVFNDVATFGFDDYIKNQSIKKLQLPQFSKILDVCTGTGDIAVLLAKKYPDSKIIGIDFSEQMLDVAQKKAISVNNIEFIRHDVLELPFDDETFDACFVSYGLRNLDDFDKGLAEMNRVLKKGGYLSNLDLGKPNRFINIFFRPFFFKIMPLIGQLFAKSKDPFKYLAASSVSFYSPNEICEKMTNLGLKDIKTYNYLFGVIAQQVAIKK